MIERKFADAQIKRMAELDYFPTEPAAIKELAMALMVCENDSCALGAIAKVMEDLTVCPKPAELRMRAYEANAAIPKSDAKCDLCGGSGYRTVFKLVTYRGNSLVIQKSERLDGSLKPEDRSEFGSVLPESQAILSAAEPCSCLPPTHLARTAER